VYESVALRRVVDARQPGAIQVLELDLKGGVVEGRLD
jgi:hypothetical protein